MRDIVAGVVLIGIGLVRGDSVFFGDFNVLNIIFDALGVFFLVRGGMKVAQAKKAA